MIGQPLENIPSILSRAELGARQQNDMFDLLTRHFDGVSRAQFERDLAEKSHVILLHRGPRLVGFSTLLAYDSGFAGETFRVIYSGDTIVAPEAWRSTALARAWIACVRRLREDQPRGKCYWLLLTSGFRTYRFLPVFWREFHPRHDSEMPAGDRRLRDHLARERFGAQYDPAAGIVRFLRPQQLRGELNGVPGGRDADPHIAFFLSHNPGHERGDELVCLTELSDENLTAAGWRMVESRAHEPAGCHR
jgi:hypothetical protein